MFGLVIFDDYGLSYDDPSVRHIGMINVNYILKGDEQLLHDPDKYYSPLFEIFLVMLEKLLRFDDSRRIYLMRHLVTFLLFYSSVFVFYLLCKQRFHDWKISLCGSLFLIASPRIFAHSFYNSKDLAFLSVFIISIYTLITYLEHKTRGRLYLHAFVCASLVCVRILGILVPCFTLFFIVGESLLRNPSKASIKKAGLAVLQYSVIVVVFIRLFFPILWEHTMHNFLQAFSHMKQYPWTLDVLYLGEYINAAHLPRHYIPVWMSITTPLLYLFLFVIGVFGAIIAVVKNPLLLFSHSSKRDDAIFLLWLFLPMLAVLILKSVLYDGWRHLFFVYPAFLLLALHGLYLLCTGIKLTCKGQGYKAAQTLLLVLIILGVADPVSFMIRNHPYENLYFNRLAGSDMNIVKQRFELDYWGLAYTEALNYLAKNDPSQHIKVVLAKFPRKFCAAMLPAQARERIICSKYISGANYFLGNFRMNRGGYPCEDKVYSVSVDGAKIAVVYRANTCKPGRY